ncbi:MAG: hypothetical protein AVDCRST_MAG40-2347, partial [uncultured Gemmatimonadaceae bacterium]
GCHRRRRPPHRAPRPTRAPWQRRWAGGPAQRDPRPHRRAHPGQDHRRRAHDRRGGRRHPPPHRRRRAAPARPRPRGVRAVDARGLLRRPASRHPRSGWRGARV